MRMRIFYRLQFERDDFLIYFFFHSQLHIFLPKFKLSKIIDEYNVYYLEHSIHGWSILFGSFKKNKKYEDSRIPFTLLF